VLPKGVKYYPFNLLNSKTFKKSSIDFLGVVIVESKYVIGGNPHFTGSHLCHFPMITSRELGIFIYLAFLNQPLHFTRANKYVSPFALFDSDKEYKLLFTLTQHIY
jgi:hypothetical protein